MTPNTPAPVAQTELTREQWIDRYVAYFVERAGEEIRESATDWADEDYALAQEDGSTPEESVDNQISYWDAE